jgi:uncharacterized protein YndB with AHSA1/START domain
MRHQLRVEDLGFVDRAPLRITATRDLTAGVHQVWPWIAEADRWPQWFAAMSHAAYAGDAPPGVGAVREVTVRGLRLAELIVAFDELRRFAFVVTAANVPALAAMVEVVDCTPTPTGGTRVTYTQAVELAWWARPAQALVRRQLHGELRAGLVGLDAVTCGT